MASGIIQARIDAATAKRLAQLRRRTGLSDSELVRKGLELLSEATPRGVTRRIRGLGRFASGQVDLGSDKRHLRGFGKS